MADKKKPLENSEEVNEQTAPVQEETGKGKKKQMKTEDIQAQLSAMEQKVTDSEALANEAKDKLMRTAAEYDNYRKRTQKEMESAFTNGIAHAAQEMLPVLDVLEAAANAPTQDEDYKKGVILTLAKCQEVFKKLGIEEIDCAGKPFDPELHNAVMQEETDEVESGCVCRVMQKGYINSSGKVVRHAMVAVKP